MDGVGTLPTLLTQPKDMTVANSGGKAAALAQLAKSFPVPAFFVIPAEAITDDGVMMDLSEAIASLGESPFAVRSSGREEDGSAAAHPGQFDTELNVPADEIAAAALRVWRSGFSETLADYRRAHGLSDAPQPPAVLVQCMVDATAAGVAFSADPVSGRRDHVIINAVAGLADALVSGEVEGDQYTIDLTGDRIETCLAGNREVLTEGQSREVAELARRAADHFGSPQDIEFAFDASGLKLLQSRPITTLPPEPAEEDPTNFTIWDNSNIVESYPGVVSPLTFSFARYTYAHVYQAFLRLMGVRAHTVSDNRAVFENMLGRIEGRVYYNLLNWYRALALFPGFKANRAFMEGMMGVSEALPEEIATRIAQPSDGWLTRFVDNARLARVGLGLIWHDRRLKRTIRNFYDRLETALARPNDEIDALGAVDLVAEYRRLETALLAKWDAPLINDFLCMIAFGASRKALEKWAGDAGLAYHAERLIGQGDIISAEPARRIREMGEIAAGNDTLIDRLAAADRTAIGVNPKLEAAFNSYLETFGDRCTQELKLESLTLHDDATSLLMAIAASARAPKSSEPSTNELPELSTLIKSAPKRWLARRLLSWSVRRVRDRENLRFERTRLFGRVRRLFLAMGARLEEAGQLDARRDVFMLTVEELLAAIEGAEVTQDLRALVSLRRKETSRFEARLDPPERISVYGAHRIGVHAALQTSTAADAIDQSTSRIGLPCCAGTIEAKVRVIHDPRTQALQPGEILVARHTDPGWIAVFANAAGVIAERGSLLSHSAIVAREMGVPCVVALKDATRWLKTGDKVRLDGRTGQVEKISEEVPA